jgi:hypothetical protein
MELMNQEILNPIAEIGLTVYSKEIDLQPYNLGFALCC